MILSKEVIQKINDYLEAMEFGEVILIRHQNRITVDVKNRDRKLDIKIDK